MSQTQSAATRIPLILLQLWWAILLAAVAGGLLAYGYSALQTPLFHSTASVYFSMRSATSGSDINQGSAYTQNQMLSFAQLAKSAAVLDGVQKGIADKGVKIDDTQLRRMVAVSIPQNTVILDITVASAKPEVASDVANLVAENLTDAVYDIAPKDAERSPTIDARVVDPAVPAAFQSSPNKTQDAILGVIVGGLLAVLGLTVWTLLDRRVRSVTALDEVTDLPVLGQVPYRRGGWETAAFLSSPNGSASEAHRQVRSALKFSGVERRIETLAVTSAIASEGKTTTAVNLALAFVELGQRVLLVDADLRRPNVANVLGLENIVGLSTVLVGSVGLEDAIVSIPAELDVLVAGEHVPNPAQLLASHRMTEVLSELREQYDLLIIDTAPVLSVADATIISQYVDSTIVVTNTRKTSRTQLQRCIASLHSVGANLAGIVLNKVRERKNEKYLYTAES